MIDRPNREAIGGEEFIKRAQRWLEANLNMVPGNHATERSLAAEFSAIIRKWVKAQETAGYLVKIDRGLGHFVIKVVGTDEPVDPMTIWMKKLLVAPEEE